jgi:hypothetical protein
LRCEQRRDKAADREQRGTKRPGRHRHHATMAIEQPIHLVSKGRFAKFDV